MVDEQLITRALGIIVFGAVGFGLVIMALGPILSWVDKARSAMVQTAAVRRAEHERRRQELKEAIHQARLHRYGVKDNEDADVANEQPAPRPSEPSGLSVLGRTEDRAPEAPAAATYTRAQLLTLYRLLRAHEVSREKARPILKEAGIPLSNDVWAAAAPVEEEPEYITPIAGRPTRAKYYDDPEMEYQAPGI